MSKTIFVYLIVLVNKLCNILYSDFGHIKYIETSIFLIKYFK